MLLIGYSFYILWFSTTSTTSIDKEIYISIILSFTLILSAIAIILSASDKNLYAILFFSIALIVQFTILALKPNFNFFCSAGMCVFITTFLFAGFWELWSYTNKVSYNKFVEDNQ